ncbi:vWA domain-containing protein [Desulfurococcus amylolyticus]|uniref:Uncharacterized protein containing a von Willebrand factor type A (VWA) domain n=1 Tax=Desulfurococcus amylolyticus DSM 16532 TaxID=768672 RepID=I3XS09_DESAM|nr:VWA domain-containing protein [Desulfurococcus amylolyticus]AFL66733.1 uncharacterized protein containing a von Willebrand factor type A (vWA) domain [Desulfurococcus amylolyticus DSM 16532]
MSSENKEGYLRGVDYGDPVVRYRGGKIKRLAELFAGRKLGISNEFAADIFYLFYLPVPLLREDDPGGGEEYRVLRALKDSPNFPIVKSRTIMDSFISSIAASVFLSEVKLLEEVAGKSKVESGQMDVNENTEVSRIVEKALTTVNIDIENVKKLKSIVEGLEPGSTSQLSLDEDVAEVLKLARDIDVKRILEMLKGLKPWELGVEKKKRRFKHGEIAGYEYGRDLERIVPSNLILPSEVFYTRFAQRKLLLYEKVVEESLGPMYVLLDKSGSMDGVKITWGKAVAISLYLKAVKTHREFYLRFFDSQPYPLYRIGRIYKPSEVLKLLDYIARVKGAGGTDISRAIITACTDIRTGSIGRESDIILITDGVDRIAENMVRYNLKKTDSRLITVMIMGDNENLRNISYKYLKIEKLDKAGMLRVVEFD